MAWTIDFDKKAIKALKKLPETDSRRIRDFLHSRVKPLDIPRQLGTGLEGDRPGHLWRYRVGEFRLLCELHDDRLVVLVVKVGHRRDVYR